MKVRALLLLGSVVCLAASGCGADRIDSAKLEKKLRQGSEKVLGLPIKSVKCPDDIPLKKGDVFYCTATSVRGGKSRIRVRQDDDKGNVSYLVPA